MAEANRKSLPRKGKAVNVLAISEPNWERKKPTSRRDTVKQFFNNCTQQQQQPSSSSTISDPSSSVPSGSGFGVERSLVSPKEAELTPTAVSDDSFLLEIPQYTSTEKKLLYGNNRFVIDRNDIMKEPYEMSIWQIQEESRTLIKLYPASHFPDKTGNAGDSWKILPFHCAPTSPVHQLQFSKEEFRNTRFFEQYQPIVVRVATEASGMEIKTQSPDSKDSKWEFDTASIVAQFVYIDKPFFFRMIDCMGKIEKFEYLREDFKNSLRFYVIVVATPLLSCWQEGKLGRREMELQKELQGWKVISEKISEVIGHVYPVFKRLDNLNQLFIFPKFKCSVLSKERVNTECMLCEKGEVQLFGFRFEVGGGFKPYDKTTLEALKKEDAPKCPKRSFYRLCAECFERMTRLHRLIHYQHGLALLKKQNVWLDIKHSEHVQPDRKIHKEKVLLEYHDFDISWLNKMFLDFQVILAEVEALALALP